MAKTRSKHQKDLYSVYKTSQKWAVNRKKKLLKAQKAAPNNEQIATALKVISYRRKTPKSPHWSHQAKRQVALAKTFNVPVGFVPTKVIEARMFQLSARVKGMDTWNS